MEVPAGMVKAVAIAGAWVKVAVDGKATVAGFRETALMLQFWLMVLVKFTTTEGDAPATVAAMPLPLRVDVPGMVHSAESGEVAA